MATDPWVQTCVKSPLNYTGGKHRILPQLLPLFPNPNAFTGRFFDVFCGGANIAANAPIGAQVHANDICKELVLLLQHIARSPVETLLDDLSSIRVAWGLSDSAKKGYSHYQCESSKGLANWNRSAYERLRTAYNEEKKKKPHSSQTQVLFLSCIIYSFNNQIRFNGRGEFNLPVGKRDLNAQLEKNLRHFSAALHARNLHFSHQDFRAWSPLDFTPEDFVYLDPPYLLTTATYNEAGRWSLQDEKDLLDWTEALARREVPFVLSNAIEARGKTHGLLEKWMKNHCVHYVKRSYANANYHLLDRSLPTREVAIFGGQPCPLCTPVPTSLSTATNGSAPFPITPSNWGGILCPKGTR